MMNRCQPETDEPPVKNSVGEEDFAVVKGRFVGCDARRAVHVLHLEQFCARLYRELKRVQRRGLDSFRPRRQQVEPNSLCSSFDDIRCNDPIFDSYCATIYCTSLDGIGSNS
jgi:hypothetical protein